MKAALYIHFPFCRKKCVYCDFYSVISNEQLIDQYLNSLQKEILLYANNEKLSQFIFKTIYFGGGTPSLLSSRRLEALFNCIFKHFKFTNDVEITMEANPESIDMENIKAYRTLGINRISIGIQSFNDQELKILGRIHDVETAISSIQKVQKAGFNNLNIDLIFGIPGQSLKGWAKNLLRALDFSPQHISMYGLTIESDTILEKQIQQGTLQRASEIMEREMYLKGIEILAANGFQQYEISNFAIPGFSSRHNRMYWNGNSYLGLGPSAHSFWQDRRQWNVTNVSQYIQMLNGNRLPLENSEQLTTEQKIIEFIFLNLRQNKGINFDIFFQNFNFNFNEKYGDIIRKLTGTHEQLFQIDHNHLSLTKYGFLLYDEICSYFN